jgi:hypothetical protein
LALATTMSAWFRDCPTSARMLTRRFNRRPLFP